MPKLFSSQPYRKICLMPNISMETRLRSTGPVSETLCGASLEVTGLEQRRHQDWFDENDDEIMSLLDEKHKAHVAWLQDKSSASKAKYENLRSTLQGKLRAMCDKWWQNKATELQSYGDTHDMKNFYCALKAVYGPTKSTTAPVMGSDGKTLLTDRKQILERWAEHFSSVLNQQSSIDQAAFDNLRKMQTKTSRPQHLGLKKSCLSSR